jgi:hypothetical protein
MFEANNGILDEQELKFTQGLALEDRVLDEDD